MLQKIFKFFKNFSYNSQTELEKFIVAKNPTNTAELEYWIDQYVYKQSGWKL